MGLWSWLFPSRAERLAGARAHLAAGRPEEARGLVYGLDGPEAEAIYEEASRALGVNEPAAAARGALVRRFGAWELTVATAERSLAKPFVKLLLGELTAAGINLDRPELDGAAFDAAVVRAQAALGARPEPAAQLGAIVTYRRRG
jgi:hypothetical protein